jgi:hypothetical protein
MAYWCDEGIVIQIEGPGGPTEVALSQPYARIGSHLQSDVVLDDPSVAKRALYLHASEAGLYCLNLDVPEASAEAVDRWLAPDDVVEVGPYRLRARLASGMSTSHPSRVRLVERGTAGVPIPVLNVFCDRLLKDKRRLRARLSLIGRRPQCSLRLRGHEVSSFHCVLYWHERRLWSVDLNASNATLLNGEPFDCREIQLHDNLDVGEFRLVYCRLSPRNWQPNDAAQRIAETWQASEFDPLPAVSPTGDFDAPAGIETFVASEVGNSPAERLLPRSESAAASRWRNADDPPAPAEQAPEATDAAHQADLLARLSEEIATLSREREDRQSEWDETSQQMLAHIEQLRGESALLREQNAELEAQRNRLQAERDETSQQMFAQIEQLRGETVHLMEQNAALEAQRDRWQAERDETSQHMFAQIEQLRGESALLREQHAALEAQRDRWQAERDELQRQLDRQADELAELKAALDESNASLAARSAAAETPPRSANGNGASHADESHLLLAHYARDAAADQEAAAHQEQGLAVPDVEHAAWANAEAVEAAEDTPASYPPSQAEQLPEPVAAETLAVVESAGDPTRDSRPPAHPDAEEEGRSAQAPLRPVDDKHTQHGIGPHDGLSTFISDRLVDLQKRHRRRRALLLWGAALAAACMSAVGALAAWQALG